MDSAILHYIKPSSMTLIQYADSLYANSCKVIGVYDDSFLNDMFIEDVNSSVCHSFREYWVTNP